MEQKGKTADEWFRDGVQLTKEMDIEGAFNCCEKVIELEPDYRRADFWLWRAGLLYDIGTFEEAIYRTIVGEKKPSREISDFFGSYKKRYEEALRSFDKSLEIDPNSVETWEAKAHLLLYLKRDEEAIECLEHVRDLRKR